MNREDFIKHLINEGCRVVRTDNSGYSIVRNVIKGNLSGVPKEDPPYPATVCRICKTLDVEAPDGMHIEARLIDEIDKNVNGNKNKK